LSEKINTERLEFVILAAGKSTRNYPHSKGLPHKSLAPFGSRKVIDHVVSQIIEAGGKHITIVVSNAAVRQAFEACFVREPEIENKFLKKGDHISLELLQSLYVPEDVKINYVIQPEPKGVGHAVGLVYAQMKNKERNIVMIWPDDIILSDRYTTFPENRASIYKRAVERYVREGGRGNMVITRHVTDPERWGVVLDGFYREKPKGLKSADAGVGFVILDRDVCAELAKEAKALDAGKKIDGMVGGEMIPFPAVNRAVERDPKLMRVRSEPMLPSDTYLDCGTLEGYEKALIYTLLTESRFNRTNFRFLRKIMPRIERYIEKEAKNARKIGRN
jgi:UTP-glucose-1-phosphate uridylyltransferase